MTVKKPIANLRNFLMNTTEDELIIRTTYVKGGWHDVEFTANRCGFSIERFINPEMEARHEFSECYKLVRK